MCIKCFFVGHKFEDTTQGNKICAVCGKIVCFHSLEEIKGYFCFGTFFSLLKCTKCGKVIKKKL